MSDIFAPLREPEPVSPLAPEEVRRGGDRLRRRRAGLALVGTVVATAIVVGGSALVVGDRLGSDARPGPVDTPGLETVIPAEFDLADGIPRDNSYSNVGAPEVLVCGGSFSLADLAIASEQVLQAGTGDLTMRGVAVYPDVATARSVATDLVARFDGCPAFTDGRGSDWTAKVQPSAHGDEGWVLTRVMTGSEPRWGRPEVIQVVRLDASLLVIQQREIHGVEPVMLTRGTGQDVARLIHRQMCLLTDEGCP
jgi:hypothetical protein